MPVIAGAASAGIQAGTGIWQMYKGSQMTKNAIRPKYEIPQAVKDKMTTAEMLQFQGLPETSKQEYIDNLSRNQAFSFNQLDSRKAGLAGTAAINQQGADAAKGLMTADANVRQANMQNLQDTRSEYGTFQDKKFTFDKANPYYETMNEGRALQGAGMQNVMSGVNVGASTLGNTGGGSSTPKKGTPTTDTNFS